MCLRGSRFRKLIICRILYIIVATLCYAFLKRVDFLKLTILRSEVFSDWPAIQCIVISRIPQVCDGNITPLTMLWCSVQARRDEKNKPTINEAFVTFSEDIITDYDSYSLFLCCVAPRKHNTMTAYVIVETPNKHYSTLLKTRVWIVSNKFFKYGNVLTGCESEAPDCPCDVGFAPLNCICYTLPDSGNNTP